MKTIWKTGKAINKVLAGFAVIAAIACLPSLHYSSAHLHIFYGVVIAHWHPGNGLSPEHKDKKTPVAEHNHALSDLFNLWTINKNQSNPIDQFQLQIFLSVQENIPVIDYFHPRITLLRSPSSARSPPADQA